LPEEEDGEGVLGNEERMRNAKDADPESRRRGIGTGRTTWRTPTRMTSRPAPRRKTVQNLRPPKKERRKNRGEETAV
jgi:hypothetical protein